MSEYCQYEPEIDAIDFRIGQPNDITLNLELINEAFKYLSDNNSNEQMPFFNETVALTGWQYQPNSWLNITLDLGIGFGLRYDEYQVTGYVPFRFGIDFGYRY